jgi:hypothetical protein
MGVFLLLSDVVSDIRYSEGGERDAASRANSHTPNMRRDSEPAIASGRADYTRKSPRVFMA